MIKLCVEKGKDSVVSSEMSRFRYFARSNVDLPHMEVLNIDIPVGGSLSLTPQEEALFGRCFCTDVIGTIVYFFFLHYDSHGRFCGIQ